MSSNLRKKTLIRPAMQLRICMTFIAASASGLTVMLAFALALLQGVHIGNDDALSVVMPALMRAYWVAMLVTIPGTLAVGILSTFLVAGPMHRFTLFLTDIVEGKQPEDCHLRAGDELTDFCDLLNKATAPLRVVQSDGAEEELRESAPQSSEAA